MYEQRYSVSRRQFTDVGMVYSYSCWSLCSWSAVDAFAGDVLRTQMCCGGNPLLSLLSGVGLDMQKSDFTEFS